MAPGMPSGPTDLFLPIKHKKNKLKNKGCECESVYGREDVRMNLFMEETLNNVSVMERCNAN
jgi:hypothetical protein